MNLDEQYKAPYCYRLWMFPIKSNAAIPKTTMTIKDDALHTVFLEP